ncbi:MAG TPA: extracellular solute-binding protein [Bacilli bacterium]
MRKRMNWTSMAMTLCLVLTVLAGCFKDKDAYKPSETSSSNNGQAVESDWKNEQTKKWHVGQNVDLYWYIGFPWHTNLKDWNEYSFLKDVKEITGVNPIVNVPTGDPTEKINIMIATGDLPDLITLGLHDPAVDKLIKSGLVYSLDELMDTYSPEFRKEIPQDVYDASKSEIDQKLYGMPGGYLPDWLLKAKDGIGAYTYSVRKDIYAELGKPDMTTPDSFYETLKAFKEKYPMINGRPSIPLAIGDNTQLETSPPIYSLMHSFGVKDHYVQPDGKVTVKFKNPQYKEFAKYMNKLYREKLIDAEAFVKGETQIQEDLRSNVFASAAYFWYLDGANAALDQAKPDSHFVSIAPLQAVEDVKFPGLARLGGQITLVSKKSKNPEAAIKFLRYMFSKDGNLLMLYGHEGEDYSINAEGKITRSDAIQQAWAKDFPALKDRTGIWSFVYLFYKPLPEVGKEAPDRMEHDRPIANKYAFDNTIVSYKMTPDLTTEEGIVSSKVDEIAAKSLPKIVMAVSEADAVKMVDEMIGHMEKAGLSKLEIYLTKQYNLNVEKFGNDKY